MSPFKLDTVTKRYTCLFEMSIDAEIFQRIFVQLLQEAAIDITDQEAMAKLLCRVETPTRWVEPRPHVMLFPVYAPPASGERTVIPPVKEEEPPKRAERKSPARPKRRSPRPAAKPAQGGMNHTEAMHLRVASIAARTPPSKWDPECLTPIPDHCTPYERSRVHDWRYLERMYLKELRSQLEAGNFVVQEEEERLQQEQSGNVQSAVVALHDALEAVRFH